MDAFTAWPNLAAMMLGIAAERPARPMLRGFANGAWRGLSWAEFAQQTSSLAHALAPYLATNDRVLLVSDSRPEVVIANVALLTLQAIPVPAYTTNLAADHAHLLRDSGARVAIAETAAHAERVLSAAAMVQGLDLLICLEPFAASACQVLHWPALLANTTALAAMRARAEKISREAAACLIYTSGTGGAPKGVVLPHRAILSNCEGATDLVAPLHLDHETYLSILPLSHSYEHTVGQYFLCAIGCEVVFARGIEHLATDMKSIRPTIMTVVPRVLDVIRGRILGELTRMPPWRQALFHRALAIGHRRLDDKLTLADRMLDPILDRLVRNTVKARFGGRLRAIVSGGARLDPEVGRFFLALGIIIVQGYGQTEAGPVISANRPDAIRIETVGPPLRGVELAIAHDGEILVRGDLVMQGYWNQPEQTQHALTNGWLHTGDIGRIDDGYLIITDRKKDIIVLSGGENVTPARIESLLMAQPAITQAVIAGDGHTSLTAYLVAAEGMSATDVTNALRHANAQLAGAEKIRRHQLVPPFTLANGLLTATQKIRRKLVIERYAPAA